MKASQKALAALALATSVFSASCSDGLPSGPTDGPQFNVRGEPTFVLLKKHGPAAAYTFEFAATTGEFRPVRQIGPLAWEEVWRSTGGGNGQLVINETTLNMRVDSVYVLELVRNRRGFLKEGRQHRFDTLPITIDISNDKGAYVLVFNSHIVPPGGDGKMEVCHRGTTIRISAQEWERHRDHGDTLGPCEIVDPI